MNGPRQLSNLRVSALKLDSTHVPLEVAVLNGSGSQITSFGSGGTQYTEGDLDATITGTALLFEGDSTTNELRVVNSTNPLPVTITGSAGSTQVSIKEILTSSGASVLDSTNIALRVNVVAGSAASTTVNVSSVAGLVAVRPSDTNWASSAGFHFDGSGNLNIAGSFSASTTVNVSSLAGVVLVSPVSTASVRVYQSTAADLNVTVAGYVAPSTTVSIAAFPSGMVSTSAPAANSSALMVRVVDYVAPSTTVQVSSVGGLVTVRPSDTSWASSAGFHFDGSGNLNIAGSFSASTQVAVSTASVTLAQVLDSSGGGWAVADSANNAIRVNVVAGAASGSTVVTVSTGSIRANLSSTAADNPVSVWQLSGPGTINTFGHLVTGSPHNQVDVQFYRSTSVADVVTLVSSNGGGATVSNGGAIFATGTNSSGAVTGISVERTRYTAGAEVYGLFTAAYTVPSTANQFMRVGLFDSSNGLFAGYESTAGFGITRRAVGSDSNVLSSAFNHDKLNGNSTSLFTRNGTPEALDPTKLNVFRVRFGWLGAAPISWDVLAPDGHWVTFHVYDWPNTSTLASLASADLPMRLECRKVNAGTDDLRIFTECWGAGTTQDSRPINDPISTGALAPLVRSVITGENSAGGGSFINVKVNPSGAVAIDGTISSLAGAVVVRSSAASALFTAYQSTAADLNVTAAQGGAWTVGQASTVWAVQLNNYSTTAQVSSLAGRVLVDQNSSVWVTQTRLFDGASVALVGSTTAPATGDNGLVVRQVGYVAPSTTVQISSLAGKVLVDQNSTVWQVQVSTVAGRVLVDQNSTAWVAQVSSVAGIVLTQLSDRDFSTKVVAVLGGDPVSTTYGVVTRQVGYSTTVQVSSVAGAVIVRSSAADFKASVYQSTAAEMLVTVYQSTAASLNATVRLQDGSGNVLESAVSQPSTAARGLVVRPVFGGALTYAASTTGQSSATTLVSSAAGSKAFVYAISITSTLAGPVYWGFYDGATLKWTGVAAAPSSAISGVNLAVSPPAYLFSNSTGEALTFNCETSNTGMRVSAAYWVST